ncbi:electron transfer flavoprotein alpha-subunit [Scheffersomyces amazonensis]|uniref:electron transfer flavoprotein alpha-subunit n=1 Tax=Scheffersomyces amazonensis TaxID=1078765 RepID=UPI00315CCB8B
MLSVGKRLFSTSGRILDTLVFVESANSKISPASLSSLNAAFQLGKPVSALVAGPEGESIVSELSQVEGLSKIIVAKGDNYNHYLAEELSPLVKAILSNESNNFTHFVTAASAVGKSLLPRVGALLDVQPISDVIKVESENTFVRPIYAGNALSTVKSSDKFILTSIRASAFPPQQITSSSAPIEEFSESITTNGRTEFVSENLITSERPELGAATKVVAGGRGLKNKETFDKLLEPLATKLNAAVGASRAAVDNGFCDNSLQIGQTGKIIAPELYIAIGISGAIQHLAGMKDSKTIVAINKDPESPIFNIADIGLVADLNDAVPELTEKL